MSGPTRLLGALWAALWVRWRLLRLWARRAFGGRQVAAAGAGYEIPLAEVPVEGVDYDSAELPDDMVMRLDGIRAGLLDHARSTATRRTPSRLRRRRVISLAMAALVSLTVLGAGANALVRGTTGVPAVDRLLGIYEENLSKPEASGRGGHSGRDLQPSATKASEPIEVRQPDGTRSVTTFYVARSSELCAATVDSLNEAGGTLGCEPSAVVAEDMRIDGAHIAVVDAGAGATILKGYARRDIESLRVRGPDGHLDVRLGDVWRPSVPDFGRLRPFVAVGASRAAGTGSSAAMIRRLAPESYSLEAITDTGQRLKIQP